MKYIARECSVYFQIIKQYWKLKFLGLRHLPLCKGRRDNYINKPSLLACDNLCWQDPVKLEMKKPTQKNGFVSTLSMYCRHRGTEIVRAHRFIYIPL